MSYDIWLEKPQPGCPECGRPDAIATITDGWNYTSNCGPMWRAAGADLAEFHDKPAGQCVLPLHIAIHAMQSDPAKYRAMDPPNGWGSYDTLLPALKELIAQFETHPDAIVKVSR